MSDPVPDLSDGAKPGRELLSAKTPAPGGSGYPMQRGSPKVFVFWTEKGCPVTERQSRYEGSGRGRLRRAQFLLRLRQHIHLLAVSLNALVIEPAW